MNNTYTKATLQEQLQGWESLYLPCKATSWNRILGKHDPRCLREGLCGIFRQRKGITQRTDTLPQSTGGIAFSHKYDPCSWWPRHLQPEDPPPPIPKTPIIGSCSLAQPYNIPKKWCLYFYSFISEILLKIFVRQLHRQRRRELSKTGNSSESKTT